MENVFCPVKTAEVSYRHQISKTLLHDGQHRMKVKFLWLVTLIMWLKRVAVWVFLILVLHIFDYTRRKAYATIHPTLQTRFQMDVTL